MSLGWGKKLNGGISVARSNKAPASAPKSKSQLVAVLNYLQGKYQHDIAKEVHDGLTA